MATSFGPSALVTPANGVTIVRLLAAPLLVALVLSRGPSWGVLALWFVLSCTDGLDGWIARRHGTTRSGAFLDPLADKALVLGAMAALVSIDIFWWVPVALIAVRELLVSLYRAAAGRQGVSIPARKSAKAKTVMQDLAVGLALMPVITDHRWPANLCLWVAVGLTLVSGFQYLLDARQVAARAV
jgi:CDP-diacylglycerol--glycerol-3-phosphate 3-phosphatidyltransferase